MAKGRRMFINTRLAERMVELEITQGQLAEALDVCSSVISRYTTGKTLPRGPRCAEIARILKTTVIDLFGLEG